MYVRMKLSTNIHYIKYTIIKRNNIIFERRNKRGLYYKDN
jgi:hypothetical protein